MLLGVVLGNFDVSKDNLFPVFWCDIHWFVIIRNSMTRMSSHNMSINLTAFANSVPTCRGMSKTHSVCKLGLQNLTPALVLRTRAYVNFANLVSK